MQSSTHLVWQNLSSLTSFLHSQKNHNSLHALQVQEKPASVFRQQGGDSTRGPVLFGPVRSVPSHNSKQLARWRANIVAVNHGTLASRHNTWQTKPAITNSAFIPEQWKMVPNSSQLLKCSVIALMFMRINPCQYLHAQILGSAAVWRQVVHDEAQSIKILQKSCCCISLVCVRNPAETLCRILFTGICSCKNCGSGYDQSISPKQLPYLYS